MQINECSTLIFKGTLHYFVAFLRYNISIMVLNGALGSDKKISTKGFGLVETLVGVAVFVAVSVAAYGGFINTLEGVKVLRAKNTATNLANEQIEIIRNLPYDDVGIVDGIPVGKIPRDQIIERDNITFEVNTSVRNVDDPFDGQIGETPNDLSP
jgi:type II secretory pathway pseudopilin PulG